MKRATPFVTLSAAGKAPTIPQSRIADEHQRQFWNCQYCDRVNYVVDGLQCESCGAPAPRGV